MMAARDPKQPFNLIDNYAISSMSHGTHQPRIASVTIILTIAFACGGAWASDSECWDPVTEAFYAFQHKHGSYYPVSALVESARNDLRAAFVKCPSDARFRITQPEIQSRAYSAITLLDIAILSNDSYWTKVMMRRRDQEQLLGRQVFGISGDDDMPMLFQAAWFESDRAAKALLELGASPNEHDQWGTTSLHMVNAIGESGLVVIALLVRNGADLDAEDAAGHTPLAKSVIRGDLAKAQCLLSLGANVPDLGSLSDVFVQEHLEERVEAVRQFLLDEHGEIPNNVAKTCIP